ncbi:hypothetical protein Q1695_004366 [Nippostrongylus brasiliensis]|nr:hypothetical protein Q1695_004366 [Nippostrongylus brasiliensis]
MFKLDDSLLEDDKKRLYVADQVVLGVLKKGLLSALRAALDEEVNDAEETQPSTLLECAYGPPMFCNFLLWAHETNQRALQRLVGDFAKNSTRRILTADQLIVELLPKTESADLLVGLKKALRVELGALATVKADCFSLPQELQKLKEGTCRAVYREIGYAILRLIEAIKEVEIDSSKIAKMKSLYELKNDEIQSLYSRFFDEKYPYPPENFPNEVHALGRQILRLM